MQHGSEWRETRGGAKVEVGTFVHNGVKYVSQGAAINEAAGWIVGYIARRGQDYVLQTWGGEEMAKATKTCEYQNNLGAWIEGFRVLYKGRWYSGRKSRDWSDCIRLRARAGRGA